MAVRPWENQFIESNIREDSKLGENNVEQPESLYKTQMKSASKNPNTSNLVSGVSSQKTGPSQSDGYSSSPGTSSSIPVISKTRSKNAKDDLAVEANSRHGTGPRSHRNPKERSRETDRSKKERLSLSNSGNFSGSQSAKANRAHKAVEEKSAVY